MASLRTRVQIAIYRRPLVFYRCLRNASTAEEEVVSVNLNDQLQERSEEEIAKICNKSALRPDHFLIYRGEHPQVPDEQKPQYMRTLKWQRKLIGLCGFKGQHDPGICFATKEEIEDLKEYEKVAFNVPLLEIRKQELEKSDQMKKDRLEREKQISIALQKQEEWKAKIRDRMNERNKEYELAQADRARLLEEVRRYFGYTIDPKDEKFRIMLALKEKEAAKERSRERKKQKERDFLAKLASLEVVADPSASKKKGKSDEAKNEE